MNIIYYISSYNNDYHLIYNFHYLKQSIPSEKILTITTVTQKNINKLEEENKGLADFTICVTETMTNTY